jgi:hypothetical protein
MVDKSKITEFVIPEPQDGVRYSYAEAEAISCALFLQWADEGLVDMVLSEDGGFDFEYTEEGDREFGNTE